MNINVEKKETNVDSKKWTNIFMFYLKKTYIKVEH